MCTLAAISCSIKENLRKKYTSAICVSIINIKFTWIVSFISWLVGCFGLNDPLRGGGRVERRCWVNFQCRGVLLVWMIVGQGPIALAVGTGWGLFGHFFPHLSFLFSFWGWSGGAMVLGKLPVPGRPTILITVGQGPTALAVVRVGVVWTFLLSSILSLLSPSLWETARYRLKYCLKGPLSPKQPTNQSFLSPSLWETARYRLKYCLKGPLNPKQPTNQRPFETVFQSISDRLPNRRE